MNKGKLYLQFFFLLFSLFPFLGYSQTYYFDNYTVQDGLSQSNVLDIIQDKNGYYWFATESGLSRFDGKNFQNYGTEDGLADNNISSMLLDSKGNMWLGHASGCLTKYDGHTFQPIRPGNFPKDKTISSLYEDKSGKIWIVSYGTGVYVLDNPSTDLNKSESYRFYGGKEGLNESIADMLEDKDGDYWFSTSIGLKIMKAGEKKFDFFREPVLPSLPITCVMEDRDGNIWMGTYSTGAAIISVYNKKNKKTNYYPTPAWINKIIQVKDGSVWALTWGGGALHISGNTIQKFTVENGLPSNKIYSIYEDREGNILMGTFGNGVAVYKGDRFISFTKNNGIIDNKVFSVAKDANENVWVATSIGISVIDTNHRVVNYEKVNGLPIVAVRTITSDKQGNIWFNSGSNIVKYDVSASKFSLLSELQQYINDRQLINSIEVDGQGNLWIGTTDGLLFYDTATKRFRSYRTVDGLAGNSVDVVYCDKGGRMWIGCLAKGLTVIDKGIFKTFTDKDGFTHNSPSSFAEDKKGNIWIGTKGGGVFAYNGTTFENYRTKKGLLSDFVSLVTVDKENNVLIGTNKGLVQYEQTTGIFKSYEKRDGFSGIETSADAGFISDDGSLWLGTVNGVVKYDPKKDKKNNIAPELNISEVRVNNKPIDISKQMEFDYKENSFSVSYVGISLSNPDKVSYSVMLEGYDQDWRPATVQQRAEFSNLSPGPYTFRVKACNADGVCNTLPASFTFNIKPPFWKTWWFILLMIATGVTVIITYIKIRERSLLREKKVLEEKVKERTAEVVEKNIELDVKNKDITASIRYAKRIQDAILLPNELVKEYLPKTFILFKPKDIVSGDFYWIYDKKDIVLVAAVDCTGHGVPGAFMSIVGHNLLDKIVGEDGVTQPSVILDALNKSVSGTLRQSQMEDQGIKDGMDLALVSFDRKTNELQYAGAFNPLWILRDGEIMEFKADKFPIGNLKVGEQKKFTNHSIMLQQGDAVYVFSDGYADQFGGPAGKKFKYKAFKDLLIATQHMNMEEQGAHINKVIEEWRGGLEQVDDILVIGTRL